VTIEAALAMLVLGDAGSASGLVWYGAGLAVALLATSLAGGWDAPLHVSVAILGLILLARADQRLTLAPIYGAALLTVSELARTCHELGPLDSVTPAAIRARLLTVAASAGLGACAAAVVALAAAGRPARSVAISAAATLAVAVMYAGIVALARRGRFTAGDGGASGADQDVSVRAGRRRE
jgi:hypothetical protein